ncbi:MAG: HTTM domain-containing protein [Bacteroidota bacterium]|nr:HTTM domain-containing protein [Bacteroidota bacterium]
MVIKAISNSLILKYLTEPVHIAPLVVLRMVFGLVMFASIIRFMLKGWIYDLYIAPKYFFTFYGFEWVRPLGELGMYFLFGLLALTSFFILVGAFYRWSTIIFFLGFTYVELIDKTNYLNHYYFISIISFLLIMVPAHRYFSYDVIRAPGLKVSHVERWTILIFKIQLAIVYFYAGLAKLNYDWLFNAMPLKIWLPAKTHLPISGQFLDKIWVAYFFSWFGAIYDLSIVFFLSIRKTRAIAYFFVVIFHLTTAWMFPIGMFPYIMILITLIYFSTDFHKNVLHLLSKTFTGFHQDNINEKKKLLPTFAPAKSKIFVWVLALHFIFQVLFPFRYLLYPGALFWTEEGFRFSWRVMLIEKAGTTFFYVEDPESGRKGEVMVGEYLTKNQEKMMATQPDMILQFAHFLKEEYQEKGITDPKITVESYVSLNGSGSRLFIDGTVNLAKEKESFMAKKWVLPFKNI